jgi:superfamily II DNA or RNA helicase
MKTLFPAQATHVAILLDALRRQRSALDTSDMGTGKTVMASQLAQQFQAPSVGVVCPKSVILNWQRELKDAGVEPAFIMNYEKLRRGGIAGVLQKVGKKLYRWQMPPGSLVIIDEVHKCKGDTTFNAQLLISLRQQGYRVLMLSGTAAKDPGEMRALGFVLGLHDLNGGIGAQVSWMQWMKKLGCEFDGFGRCEASDEVLKTLHTEIYHTRRCAHRVSKQDMPEAFRENHVERVPVAVSQKVMNAYAGVTREMVDSIIEETHGKMETDKESVLVKILRARQIAEASKIEVWEEMTRDLIDEGKSVVIFVEFVETLKALKALFPYAGAIFGTVNGVSQTSEARQAVVDSFTNDDTRLVISTIAAGGESINLHDQTGKHPRVTLISPPFSMINYEQCLGRTPRAGAKSDVIQRVLVAAGTIEEYVVAVLENKRRQLNLLHEDN